MVIGGVVFDIDDTLYLERDYVLSGFRHVAAQVGASRTERAAVARWLVDAFETGLRGNTFDRLLEVFPEIARRRSVDDLVEAYRRHEPTIRLGPGVESVLNALRDLGLRLGILSDGPLVSQEAKARALHLADWFDPIVLTAALGPGQGKPASIGFESIMRQWGLAPGSIVYVADNPEKDFAGPRAMGWLTVRLRQPGQLRHALEAADDFHTPVVEIDSVDQLLDVISRHRQ